MSDLNLEWRSSQYPLDGTGDLSLSASGDVVMADGDTMVRQAIERRLFTAVKGYIWHLEYGAGLPQRIGKPAKAPDIESIVRAQVLLESTVAPFPVPIVTVDEPSTVAGAFIIYIQYVDQVTGASVALNFQVPSN